MYSGAVPHDVTRQKILSFTRSCYFLSGNNPFIFLIINKESVL